jgi:hypothetical protein
MLPWCPDEREWWGLGRCWRAAACGSELAVSPIAGIAAGNLTRCPIGSPSPCRLGVGRVPRRLEVDLLAFEGLGVLPEPELLKPAAAVSASATSAGHPEGPWRL